MKKIISLLITVCILVSSLVSCNVFEKSSLYKEANSLIEKGEYEKAYEILKDLGDYKDAEKMLSRFRYAPTSITLKNSRMEDMKETIEIKLNKNNLTESFIRPRGTYGDVVYSLSYDDDGKLTEYKVSNIKDGETTYTDTTKYTYDKNGNMTREAMSSLSSTLQYSIEYSYDKNGNMTGYRRVNDTGEVIEHEYIYDKKGNMVEETHTWPDGKWSTSEYYYDKDGRLIKEEALSYITEYVYDDNGNLITETKLYRGTTDEDKTENTYDEKGNLIKIVKTETKKGELSIRSIQENTYDENGNLIRKASTTPRAGIVDITLTTEYTYKFVYSPFDISEKYEEIHYQFLNIQ